MRQYTKYILPLLVHTVFLCLLADAWTDDYERFFKPGIRVGAYLKIAFFAVVTLIALLIAFLNFRKKKEMTENRKGWLILIIVIVCNSFLYVRFGYLAVKHRILEHGIRDYIFTQVRYTNKLGYGSKAKNLLLVEYRYINRTLRFIDLPNEAFDISYEHSYDGFLPDYGFTVTYFVPSTVAVKELNIKDGDFTKYQTVEDLGNKKKVTYEEILR